MISREWLMHLVSHGETGWLLRSGAGLGGMRIFNMIAGLATTVLLARLLGAEDYGIYAFALGWVFILGMPLQMGLPTLVMRQVAIYRNAGDIQRLSGIIRWSFRLIGYGIVLVGVICGSGAFFFTLNDRWPVSASSLLLGSGFLLLCLMAIQSLYRSIVSGFENVLAASLPETVVRPALFLMAMIAVAPLIDLDPGIVMALHALAALFALTLASFMARRRLSETIRAGSSGDITESRIWLASLLPMTLQTGAAVINSRLDVAMLGTISGPTSVASYDVGMKIGGLLMVTQALLNASIAPRLARLYSSNKKQQAQELLTKACRLSFIPSLALVVVIWLAGPSVILILFGQSFAESHGVALILALGYLISTGVGAVGVLLNMSGHERVTANIIMLSAVINAILNAILIPIYGANGAAMATTATVLFVQAVLWHRASKLTGIRTDLFAFTWPRRKDANPPVKPLK